jgi:intracellular sulfur oxidation DsrE/DsrF family protein
VYFIAAIRGIPPFPKFHHLFHLTQTNMRQLLFAIIIVSTGAMTTFAQTASAPVTKDSATENQKFYFPASNYADSVALITAMPKLAEQVLSVYHEENKRTYFSNSIPLLLLTENYKKAMAFVDSIRKIDTDSFYGINRMSYSLAKIAEQKQKGSFDKVFQKEYAEAFNQLSFRKKVRAAWADTSWIRNDSTELAILKEKLQKENKDSINLEDSRSLCTDFFHYNFDKKVIPLMSALIGDQYRQKYPAIKSAKWAGVVPVQPIDEMPDPEMQYKLLFELTGFAMKGQDSAAKTEINLGLSEVARQINLHEANGIPRKNINVVVVTHADALYSFMTNEKYKKKYGIDNPNIRLIKELQDYGVKMLVCGQAMTFYNLELEDLVPGIKQVLTAQTVISSYQLKGYVYYDMSLRE